MLINKLVTVFYSPTHTSARIARAIASGTGIANQEEMNLTYSQPSETVFDEHTLVIVSAPVYAGRIAPTALERFSKVRGTNTPIVLVAVYGNRDYDDALAEWQDVAESQGFVPLAAGAFVGEHSFSRPEMPVAEGRPDKQDLQEAVRFGEACCRKLKDARTFARLEVKGNRPYRVPNPMPPMAPHSTAECTSCGSCIDLCPTQAISVGEQGVVVTDPARCTLCCACVKGCPSQARVFDTPFTKKLHEACKLRREPELFL